jgi:hypothetical protein
MHQNSLTGAMNSTPIPAEVWLGSRLSVGIGFSAGAAQAVMGVRPAIKYFRTLTPGIRNNGVHPEPLLLPREWLIGRGCVL